MAKRPLEEQLIAALQELEAGQPVSEHSRQGEQQPALSALLELHERLDTPRRVSPSTLASTQGKQRMFAALAAPPSHVGGFRMIPSLFSMVPKAAMLVVGGLVLTGSALGASAAAGGPNVPVALLTAVGLHSDTDSNDGGIGNAPDAAQTGTDKANERAFEGRGNADATATATGTAAAGINHAPDAAQNGKDHANEHAFLGAGNASAQDASEDAATDDAGIGNAPDAAQTGKDHANANATLGKGNAAAHPTPTATPASGITNAPGAAQQGVDNANDHAAMGAGNADGHRP